MIDSMHSMGVTEAWTPNTPATPLLWLKADVGVSTSAGKVVSWTDQSPNAYVFAARVSTNRPAYSATAWNGKKPGIQFGSAYTELVNQSAGLADLGTNFSVQIFMTFNAGTSTTIQKILSWISIGSSHGSYEIETHNDLDEVAYSSGGVIYNGNTITGSNVSTCHRLTISSVTDGYTHSWINVVPSIVKQPAASAAASDMVAIGGNAILGSNQFVGTIAEIVVYNTNTSGLVNILPQYYSYAKTKWGGLP